MATYIAQLSIRNNAFYCTERIFTATPLCGTRDFSGVFVHNYLQSTPNLLKVLAYILGLYENKQVGIRLVSKIRRQLNKLSNNILEDKMVCNSPVFYGTTYKFLRSLIRHKHCLKHFVGGKQPVWSVIKIKMAAAEIWRLFASQRQTSDDYKCD